jgi:hypothetical protein
MLTEFFLQCIFVVDIVTHAFMRFHNFEFHRSSTAHSLRIFPPRPHAFIASHRSPAEDLTYWYHPHTSPKELRILFLHGIGVGLYPILTWNFWRNWIKDVGTIEGWDPCGRDLTCIFSNYGAFTPEGENVSTASSYSTPSWVSKVCPGITFVGMSFSLL